MEDSQDIFDKLEACSSRYRDRLLDSDSRCRYNAKLQYADCQDLYEISLGVDSEIYFGWCQPRLRGYKGMHIYNIDYDRFKEKISYYHHTHGRQNPPSSAFE